MSNEFSDHKSEVVQRLDLIVSNTAGQISELGSVAYIVGAFLAFGINLGMGKLDFFESVFFAFGSWLRVGWVIGQNLKPNG